ncbi:MAG: DUF1749 domain-containing protein [Ignavibacteriae bacterium HGW-Ignavibacteriae-3]|nr:MAG: DUF1749 domain-containing protein [Ignavibacteriae bacterium HGW-Ignavibacteriae-3]
MTEFDPVIHDLPYDPDFPSTMMPAVFEEYGSKYLGTMFVASGEGPHPLIILLHGFPGNEVNYDLAQVFRRQGFNVLVFHYRGCWGSGGDHLWGNVVEDVPAALKFVKTDSSRKMFRLDSDKIILVGHSLGGFAALFNSVRYDEIKNVVSIAGFNAGEFGELIESSKMIYDFSAEHLEPSMDFVKCDSTEALLDELIINKKVWNLLNYLERLSEKNLLIIGAMYDTTAPMEIHHNPLVSALNANGTKNLKEVILETSHSFSDKRVSLARIISDWLKDVKF